MKKKILVVDDHADIREIMRLTLDRMGYEVIVASDGQEAVDKTVEHLPDLIFMDLAMPILDGVQAVAAIRRDKSLPNMPIICVTAYGNGYISLARAVGVDEILTKPIDFNNLHHVVEHYLTAPRPDRVEL